MSRLWKTLSGLSTEACCSRVSSHHGPKISLKLSPHRRLRLHHSTRRLIRQRGNESTTAEQYIYGKVMARIIQVQKR